MSKTFNFKGAKRGARTNPKKTKISISVRLDAELVLWLKKEAESRGIPYQTLMNSLLKECAEKPQPAPHELLDSIRKVLREELKPLKKAKAS